MEKPKAPENIGVHYGCSLVPFLVLLALLFALAAPLFAQEPEPLPPVEEPAPAWPPPVEEPVEEPNVPNVTDTEGDGKALTDTPGPGLSAIGLCTQREDEGDAEARCDLGAAVPMKAWMFKKDPHRGVAIVGFLGGNVTGRKAEDEGLGLAGAGVSFLFPVGERTGGAGVGWSVEWGGNGIDLSDGRLTFGFTIGGRR